MLPRDLCHGSQFPSFLSAAQREVCVRQTDFLLINEYGVNVTEDVVKGPPDKDEGVTIS